MTIHEPLVAPFRPSALRLALPAFAATMSLSALLLFAIQPMFAKMVLPSLGGAPAVWSVAMVFFQAALLAGYAYAHLLARLTLSRAALIHLAVLGAAALSLPVGVAQGFGDPPSDGIAWWLMGLFTASIGLPFVALSASAPLLQHWFASSGHAQARNPYVLYAASNLGSFAALLAYPLIIEPALTVRAQAWSWSLGFAVLCALIAATAILVVRHAPSHINVATAPRADHRSRLAWIALAAIPAGLVIAATAYISTDVAAAPLLWVLPLALYLLSFVAVFRERPWFSHRLVIQAAPFVIAPLAISLLSGDREFWLATIVLNLAALFVLALACHGELYRRRPAPALLTEFYLLTSLGGVIGGVFAGLLAPHLFDRIYEYPILIVAAALSLPGVFTGTARSFVGRIWPLLAAAGFGLVLKLIFDVKVSDDFAVAFQVALVVLAALMLLQRGDPARFAAWAAAAFLVTALWQPGTRVIERARSFFGVHQVEDTVTHRLLLHGTTIHGAQRLRDSAGSPVLGRPEPLAYYYRGGPLSEGIEAARKAHGLNAVAVVGLGAGSLACYRQGREEWTFFEIDPEVVRLARDPRRFTFLSECAPDARIVLGDARLTLNKSPQKFDLIVLDAFSSDAIPVHLLTREALRGYLSRLTPRGMIVMHISNRHMELADVATAVGAAEGLVTLVKTDKSLSFKSDYRASAMVAAMARTPEDLAELARLEGWHAQPTPRIQAWTDDYANVVAAILRKKFNW